MKNPKKFSRIGFPQQNGGMECDANFKVTDKQKKDPTDVVRMTSGNLRFRGEHH